MKKLLQCLVVVLVILAVFSSVAGFSYIGLDDAGYTFRNPFVATGLSFSNVSEAFTNFRHGGIWMPITYISYMVDIEASKFLGVPLSVLMHIANVILHVLNALILFFIAHRLSVTYPRGRRQFAILLAVIFWAIHPLRVEPVAWIACRKEMLWVFFTLSGLFFWLKSFAADASSRRVGLFRTLTVLLFVAACLSKPTAMCFPVLAGIIHWFLCLTAEKTEQFRVTKSLLFCYVIMIVMAGCTALAAAYSQTHVAGQEAVALFAAPLHYRIVHALSALGFYIRGTLWPSGLHIDCRIVEGIMPLGAVSNLIALAVAVIALVLFAVKVRAWQMSRTSALFWLPFVWCMVPIVPTLGLLGSFGIEAHADRFTYLPSMAIVFIAALMPIPAVFVSFTSRGMMLRLVCLAVVAYAIVSVRQTRFWRDDHTAHLRALDCDPLHPRAMVHVGDALCAKGKFDKGIGFYRRSLALRPREYVKYRLAYALASRGNWDDYLEVKRLGADVAENPSLDTRGMMLDALGTAYMVEGDWEKAAKLFEASIAAPGRFWPKVSTKRKLDECLERIK